MKVQIKNRSLVSYLFTLLLLIGVACSSDDNRADEENPLSKISFKIDGEQWHAEDAIVQTLGGTDWEEEVYLVNITGTRGIDDTTAVTEVETFTLHFYIDPSNFNNPRGIYPVPPPDNDNMDEPGYAIATYTKEGSELIYFSVDPADEARKVGEVTITGFEIGQQMILGKGYVNLSGTFDFEMFGVNKNTGALNGKIEIKSGVFDVKTPFFL